MAPKVIIVGAGIAGLSMAHSLHLANIDYVVLERRPKVVNPGGGIVIMPQGMRVIHQFGLYEKAQEVSFELHAMKHYGLNGQNVHESAVFDFLKENHGYPSLAFARPNLTRVLYDNLPNHETLVRTSAGISSISMNDDGVVVHLEDGSTITGDIIIGADGTHSTVRRLLVEAEPSALDGQATFSDHCFKILYGHSRTLPQMRSNNGTFFARHGKGWFMQYSADDEEETNWAIYEVQEEGRTYGQKTFSDQELKEFIDKYRDVLFSQDSGVTIGEILAEASFVRLDWMDEGYSTKWYHDRAALIGDAAVKVNPSQAQGGNSAIETAATLANEINALLKRTPSPTTSDWVSSFSSYQSSRKLKMEQADKENRGAILTEAWNGWGQRILWTMIHKIVAYRPEIVADVLAAPWVRRSSKLDYVEHDELKPRIPWLDLRDSPKPVGTVWTGLSMFLWALAGYRPYY